MSKQQTRRGTMIERIKLPKNLLETYESITEASKQNNIPISSISSVCKNKRKTAGGFIWHYA